jgi:hypothetical protein
MKSEIKKKEGIEMEKKPKVVGLACLKNGTWWNAALTRAIKTFSMVLAGGITGNGIGLTDVNWQAMLSIATTAAIYSLLVSTAGIPEVKEEETE